MPGICKVLMQLLLEMFRSQMLGGLGLSLQGEGKVRNEVRGLMRLGRPLSTRWVKVGVRQRGSLSLVCGIGEFFLVDRKLATRLYD